MCKFQERKGPGVNFGEGKDKVKVRSAFLQNGKIFSDPTLGEGRGGP